MSEPDSSKIEKEIRAALAEAGFAGVAGDPTLRVAPLASLTNRAFSVRTASENLVMRLPRPGSAHPPDRPAEAVSLAVASTHGIGAPYLFFSEQTGVLIMQALDAEPVTPDQLRGNAPVLARIGRNVAQLHAVRTPFRNRLDPIALIDRTLQPVAEKAQIANVDHLDLAKRIRNLFNAQGQTAVDPVPSHADLVCNNILHGSERVWLIDWEFSLMADRHWDLAYFSLDADLSEADEAAFLSSYAEMGESPDTRRLTLYKCLCDLVSGLWALEQQQLGNPALDFDDYAGYRLRRAEQCLARFRSISEI